MSYVTVSPALVSSLIQQYPPTREDLAAICDPRDPTRFQGTYEHKHGGVNRGDGRYKVNYYRARVFKFFELGSGFESQRSAAAAVVAFYKCYFGDKWQSAFKCRKMTPWRVRFISCPDCAGYAADLYVRGNPIGITYADVGQGRKSQWTWKTQEEAKLAVREAMRRRFEKERDSLPIPATGLLFWRS